MCALRNNEPDYRTTNLRHLTMYGSSKVQSYPQPSEQFPATIDLEIDAYLNLETDVELRQPLWDADLAPLDSGWLGQPFQEPDFFQYLLNNSLDSTLTDNWDGNYLGPLNSGTQIDGYFQLYSNPDSSDSFAVSASAPDSALSLESFFSAQGHHQPQAPSPNAAMSKISTPTLPSPSTGVYVCEMCTKTFNKKFQLKYVNTSNLLLQLSTTLRQG